MMNFRTGDVSDCGKYLLVTIQKDCRDDLVYFANLEETGEINGKLNLTEVIGKFEADYNVSFITN